MPEEPESQRGEAKPTLVFRRLRPIQCGCCEPGEETGPAASNRTDCRPGGRSPGARKGEGSHTPRRAADTMERGGVAWTRMGPLAREWTSTSGS